MTVKKKAMFGNNDCKKMIIKKKNIHLFFLLCFVFPLIFIPILFSFPGTSHGYECGEVMTEGTWKGVVGYHNGSYHGGLDPDLTDNIWTCGSLTDYGYQYQCVEYVNRFYYEAGMKKSIWPGDANEYFNNAASFGLQKYENSVTIMPPKTNDILCFDDGGNGHVAIVNAVTLVSEDRYRIDLVEQNFSDTGSASVYMNFNPANQTYDVEDRGGYAVQGWLRIPYSTQLYAQDPAATITVNPGETYAFAVYYKNTIEPPASNLITSVGALDWKNDAPDASYELTLQNNYRNNDSLAKFHYIELHSVNRQGEPTPSFLYPGDGIWISNDRVRVVAQSTSNIGYNQNAGFIFQGKVPDTAEPGRTYDVYFRPYHSTGGYLEDWGNMHFTLQVESSPGYSVGQGAPPTIEAMLISAYSGNEILLGESTAQVIATTSGFGTTGYYQRFENGSIQMHSNQTFIIYDEFYQAWGDIGYASWAGFPMSNVYVCSWGSCQDFEGGFIKSDGSLASFVSTTHPDNLNCIVQADNSVLCNWDNRISANGISVYRAASPAERIADLGPGEISFVDNTAEANRAYTYFVTAYNNTDESPSSNQVLVNSEIWNTNQVLGQNGNYDFAGIYEFDNLTIGDNVEITSSGISQLVLYVHGTLTFGKNAVIRVRNGFYPGTPTNPVSDLTEDNLLTMGTGVGGFRVYPDMFGKGGDGGNGSSAQKHICFSGWHDISGYGGGGGGGGYGGGTGGTPGNGGGYGNPNGGNGGDGGGSGASAGGLGGGATRIGSESGYPEFDIRYGDGGGGGNGARGGYGGFQAIQWCNGGGSRPSYDEYTYRGGNSGGGGGYGGGILTIIADHISYDNENPPLLLVSGQLGGRGGHYGGGDGDNGEGGLIIIESSGYSFSHNHWNLDSITYGNHSQGDGGHGIQIGNPQKVFVNSMEKNLFGTVRNLSNGTPIDSVTVSINVNQETHTDSEGYYNFGLLSPGLYDITFSKSGYQFISITNLEIKETEATELNVDFPISLSGTVTDKLNGSPIASATVSTNTGETIQTDVNGYYELGSLVPGTYVITVSRTGYQTIAISDVVINAGEGATLNIGLPISLSGTVTDKLTGNPIINAIVSANTGESTQTDFNGYYELSSLVPGIYEITVNKTGYQTIINPSIVVTAGQGTSLNIALPISLSGTVTDMITDNPILNVTVSANTGESTHTITTGYYELGSLAPGVYEITFSKTGYETVTVTDVAINAGEGSTLNMELTTPGPLNFVTTSLPPAEVGVDYNPRVRITGGSWPYRYSIAYGSLPSGLFIDPDYGNIAGLPTTPGSYTFAVGVTDSLGVYAEREFTIEVTLPLIIESDALLPRGMIGEYYQSSIVTSGGTEPHTLTFTGDLPLDLYMTSNGNIRNDITRLIDFSEDILSYKWNTSNTTYVKDEQLYFEHSSPSSTAEITLDSLGGWMYFRYQYKDQCGGNYLGQFDFYIDGQKSSSSKGSGVVQKYVTAGTHTFKWVSATYRTCQHSLIDYVYFHADLQGSHNFTVTVTDNSGRTASKQFQLDVDDPLVITTNKFNDGIVGKAYNQSLSARGGYGNYTWDVYSGILPDGLLLDSASGVILGTPTEATYGTIVLSVSDEYGRIVYKDFTLQVADPLQILTTTLPNGLLDELFSEAIRLDGGIGPFTFSYAGQLPAGLGLNTSTGVISGTPSLAGYTNVTITVVDSTYPTTQAVTQNLGIRVTSQLTILTSAVLPKSKKGVAINPLILVAGGGPSPYSWEVTGGYIPDGITLNSQTGELSGTPADKGDFVFTIQVTDAIGGTASKEFFIHVSGDLSIVTGAIPDGAKGFSYSFTLEGKGGLLPYSWRIKSGTLPSGLAFNGATGTINGRPTTRQTYSFTIEVSDSDSPAQTAEKTYIIEVLDDLYIYNKTLPNGRVDEAYTATIKASLGDPPYSWRLDSGVLPPGLTLTSSPTVATLEGTPLTTGTYVFTIEVTDNGTPVKTSFKEFTVEVYGDVIIETLGLKSAFRGVPYSDSIIVSGGELPYSWRLVGGSLPAGLRLNSTTGHISGITNLIVGHSSTFRVRVTDSGNPYGFDERDLVIYVIDPLSIVTENIQGAMQNAYYATTIEGEGGVSPHNWTIQSGSLPNGIQLDAGTGVISGTPILCGSFPFTVKLEDSAPLTHTDTHAYNLNVLCTNDYSISGTVASLEGVNIALSGDDSMTTTTDAQGTYTFQPMATGIYTVTPEMIGYRFNPASRDVTVIGLDISGVDFEVIVCTNTYFEDSDGDNYGNANASLIDCEQPAGYVTDNTDCNDNENSIYPGAAETCDNRKNDCNNQGAIDGSGESWYAEATNCGQGVCANIGQLTCSGGIRVDTCIEKNATGDDTDCDNVDDDCDGAVDEHYVTASTECGQGVCYATGQRTCESGVEVDSCLSLPVPENPEVTCNDGKDNDCDGAADGNDLDCQDISGTRTMPSCAGPGMDIDVGMDIIIDEAYPPAGLIVSEYIPIGWTINSTDPVHTREDPLTGEIGWVFVGNEVIGRVINYSLHVPDNEPVDTVSTFYGELKYNDSSGSSLTITAEGDFEVEISQNCIPFNPYDTDSDWIIGDFELLDAIDAWAAGNLGDFELLDLIDFWAAGCYHWDDVAGKFVAGC